jgi:hypothetical protein
LIISGTEALFPQPERVKTEKIRVEQRIERGGVLTLKEWDMVVDSLNVKRWIS